MHEKVLADKTLFFDRPFTQKINYGWYSFSHGEKKLREMISSKAASDDITEYCCELLSPAFSEVCFEVGFNGEKYDLILTPEKNKLMLFFLDAFKKQAPEKVLKNWNIILGRPACGNQILGFHGEKISPADVLVKLEKDEKSGQCRAVGYSKKLLHVLPIL